MQDFYVFLHKSPLFLVKNEKIYNFLHNFEITLAFWEKM